MEVINPRSSLLSNFEVLTLLRELESDHIARTKTAVRIKKEEDIAGNSNKNSHISTTDDISENLRTIEIEAIQYLSADYQPTSQQSEAGITQLVRDLAPYGLTKAEKLQVVNLAPKEPVELYVIVEELEDRFGDQMENILSVVSNSLSDPVAKSSIESSAFAENQPLFIPELAEDGEEDGHNWQEVYDANEVVDDGLFDDTGEGAGVEGDLDMEED